MIIVKDKAKNSPLFISRNTITTITNTNNSGGGNGIDIDELNKYLADYVTEEELKNKNYATITALSDKQDKLVSGDNIKTINGKSILGEGNITIQGEGGNIDLSEYITKTELDNKGYLTSIPSEYITDSELEEKGYITEIPSEYVTETELNNKGYLKSIPSEYITETELLGKDYATNTTVNSKQDELVSGQNIKTINGTSILGSGNITIQGGTSVDLSNYVTKTELNSKGYITEIPSEYITESELSNKGYITGIPSEYITETELNQKGYITSIPSEYITETELNNKGYATTEALNGKQEKLTSGDNIKTINGQSILGKGNITIEGGNGNGNANIVELTQAEYDVLVTNGDVDEETMYLITDSVSNIKTINGESLIGDGDITIEGGSTNIIELTQEEYDNLEYKDNNTLYVITDAPAIDVPDTSNFATQDYVDDKLGDIESILNNIIGQE